MTTRYVTVLISDHPINKAPGEASRIIAVKNWGDDRSDDGEIVEALAMLLVHHMTTPQPTAHPEHTTVQ